MKEIKRTDLFNIFFFNNKSVPFLCSLCRNGLTTNYMERINENASYLSSAPFIDPFNSMSNVRPNSLFPFNFYSRFSR